MKNPKTISNKNLLVFLALVTATIPAGAIVYGAALWASETTTEKSEYNIKETLESIRESKEQVFKMVRLFPDIKNPEFWIEPNVDPWTKPVIPILLSSSINPIYNELKVLWLTMKTIDKDIKPNFYVKVYGQNGEKAGVELKKLIIDEIEIVKKEVDMSYKEFGNLIDLYNEAEITYNTSKLSYEKLVDGWRFSRKARIKKEARMDMEKKHKQLLELGELITKESGKFLKLRNDVLGLRILADDVVSLVLSEKNMALRGEMLDKLSKGIALAKDNIISLLQNTENETLADSTMERLFEIDAALRDKMSTIAGVNRTLFDSDSNIWISLSAENKTLANLLIDAINGESMLDLNVRTLKSFIMASTASGSSFLENMDDEVLVSFLINIANGGSLPENLAKDYSYFGLYPSIYIREGNEVKVEKNVTETTPRSTYVIPESNDATSIANTTIKTVNIDGSDKTE
ncbi:MAG: hypothetical protein LBI29_03030, partial [Rickettsiales bacterium]|nr:hypothetical protein [Rickettsiales bacterium]